MKNEVEFKYGVGFATTSKNQMFRHCCRICCDQGYAPTEFGSCMSASWAN